jgi:chromosome segregation ATPase
MTLIASEGLPDCVSDGVRHQVSAMVTEVSAQKLAHERLAARLELAERRGSSARQQLCALRETLRAAEREVLQRRAAAAAGSTPRQPARRQRRRYVPARCGASRGA